jgi:hypothetical protein
LGFKLSFKKLDYLHRVVDFYLILHFCFKKLIYRLLGKCLCDDAVVEFVSRECECKYWNLNDIVLRFEFGVRFNSQRDIFIDSEEWDIVLQIELQIVAWTSLGAGLELIPDFKVNVKVADNEVLVDLQVQDLNSFNDQVQRVCVGGS